MMGFERIETREQLQALRHKLRAAGANVALVPTMGALHAGHMALVSAAKQHGYAVIVSVFVNPSQFGPHEDFERYPRTLDADCNVSAEHGAVAVWAPEVGTIYPPGFSTRIEVNGVSEGLCGSARPGHFSGVATVVARLLMLAAPDAVYFGEKDYQQCCVIRRMMNDLALPISMHTVPTMREHDGLALSSRNRYLTQDERRIAPALYAVLLKTADRLVSGADCTETLQEAREQIVKAGFTKLDYLALCDNDSLVPLQHARDGARLLAAGWLGATRLIDNVALSVRNS